MTARVPPAEPPAATRVRHNDYGSLDPPALGAWEPRVPVSVVVPAHGGQHEVDLTLAALAAQSYPAALTEVIVVHRGDPPVGLPEIRPARTRIVASAPGWGPEQAFHAGVLAAEAPVVHRLDAGRLVHREHLEAHMRWHHRCGYLVVLGHQRSVPHVPGRLDPAEVYAAVRDGRAAGVYAGAAEGGAGDLPAAEPDRTGPRQRPGDPDGPRTAGTRAWTLVPGAIMSLPAGLYHQAGGMAADLPAAGDLEFGYRVCQAGAVFVADQDAGGWHLDPAGSTGGPAGAARVRLPVIANRVPQLREYRRDAGRQWLVPGLEVVVGADGAAYEDVAATVDGALGGTLPDVAVRVTGPWGRIDGGPAAPLDDPLLDLRLVRDTYTADGRVDLVDSVPATAAPAPFRLTCPAGWVPTPDGLRRLLEFADEAGHGIVMLALTGAGTGLVTARLERTSAISRARTVLGAGAEGAELDDAVHEMFGVFWVDGTEWALARRDAGNPVP